MVVRQGSISRGPNIQDDFADVPVEDWPELIEIYRWFCKRALPKDCRHLLRFVEQGAGVNWAGYGAREAYIRDGLGLEPAAVEWALAGLRLTDPDEAVPYEQAQSLGQRLARPEADGGVAPLAKYGANQHTGGGDNITSLQAGDNGTRLKGTSAAYLVARLKRDAPEVAERLAAGEFRSARAAGIAAGIVKPPSWEAQVLALWKRGTPEQRAAVYPKLKLKG